METVNQRERVSQLAWRKKHKQAIRWTDLNEWRSMEVGDERDAMAGY
jgi:hypothetical protein